MKQVLQNYKTGELRLADVPRPALRAKGVLVATRASLISAGTEKMKVDVAKKNLLGKAMERPDQVKKVIESVRQQGLLPTWRVSRSPRSPRSAWPPDTWPGASTVATRAE